MSGEYDFARGLNYGVSDNNFANFNQQQEDYLQNLGAFENTAPAEYANLAGQTASDLVGSEYAVNPALQAVLDQNAQKALENTAAQAALYGRTGSTDFAEAAGRGITEAQAPLIAQDYQNFTARQDAARQNLNQYGQDIFAAELEPIERQGFIGDQYQAREQAELDAQIQADLTRNQEQSRQVADRLRALGIAVPNTSYETEVSGTNQAIGAATTLGGAYLAGGYALPFGIGKGGGTP